ncbi:hypothetical protein [Arcticibacter sp. MXS-1]|uniref:hypothetical protein n=1 Tax=Arcticibacter sp. MXS-1 TaxID=3341726 RepID=UPI0035A96D9B
MRQILLLFLITSSVFARSRKEITLEDIFKQGKFAQRVVYGLNSMKDGKGYASVESGNTSIHLYSKLTDFILKNL